MIFKLIFIFKTFIIIGYHWLIYCYTKDYNKFIINIAERLSQENIFYGKMIQAISCNTELMNDELSEYLFKFTNKVYFTDDDIDIDAINSLYYYKRNEGYRMQDLKYEMPINSGLISLIYCADLNGKKVIVKIKRKNILKKFNEAFDNISLFMRITDYIKYINKLNIHKIFYENKKLLLEQLDFINEVNNIKLFKKIYENIDYVVIPNAYEEYTLMNENIIVMEYLEGKTISHLTFDEKETYSRLFINFGLKSFLIDGIYHADMHPGNIIFMNDFNNENPYKLGIIDFGLIGKLNREEQSLFYDFLLKILSKEYDSCSKHMIYLMTEPDSRNKKNVINIKNKEDLIANDILVDDFKNILINVVEKNKKFTLQDLVKLNNLLSVYNIQLTYSFCNVQMAMAVCESTNNALCVRKSFIECFQEESKNFYFMFG